MKRVGIEGITRKNILNIMGIALGVIGVFFIIKVSGIGYNGDEMDVVTGSWLISKKWVLYRDIFSHHMPFPYYFMAIFSIFGVTTFEGLRLGFALTTVIFLVFIAVYFRKKIELSKSGTFIFIYAASILYFDGNMMLADSFFAFSVLALFLMVYVNPTLEFSTGDKIIISVCTFVAFSSTVIAVYPLIIFFGYYIVKRIRLYIAIKQKWISEFKKDLVFVLIVLAPFIIWLIYMVCTNSLFDFIENGILFNSKYYAAYSENQTPISLITQQLVFIKDFFIDLIVIIKNIFFQEYLIKDYVVIVFARIAIVIFSVKLFVQGKKELGIFLFLFTFFTYMRGDNFHGVSFYIIALFCLTILLVDSINKCSEIKDIKQKCCYAVISILIIIGVGVEVSYSNEVIPSRTQDVNYYKDVSNVINAITEDGDYIWTAPIAIGVYYYTQCYPANRNIFYLPWQSDQPGENEKIVTDFVEKKPKAIYFEGDKIIWNVSAPKDYAKEIKEYLDEHYFVLESINPNMYFRNEERKEIVTKLSAAGYEIK